MSRARLLAVIAASSVLFSATAQAEVDKKTERLWKANCASCHGATGKADTEQGQKMKMTDMSSPAFQAKKDDELRNAILNGVKTQTGGVTQQMDGFKDQLTPDQVNALVAYVRTLKS
jgi:mono/diheme cytochrome c family protein